MGISPILALHFATCLVTSFRLAATHENRLESTFLNPFLLLVYSGFACHSIATVNKEELWINNAVLRLLS